ncbi:UvrD-helicase domain-containing protein [Edaphobacter aggregans]|uniref:UvrD-helicase domain-containing protein n=1 Tax=Edaphobacter aggregans TaxID=570835 RepID=UPI0009FFC014
MIERDWFFSLFEAYEEAKGSLLDEQDLLIRADATVATSTNPSAWKAVLVDEFQDLNLCGLSFLKTLAGENGNFLFFAGDHRQRIYRTLPSFRVIGQEKAADVESEPPNLVFRITSKVSFFEIGVGRFDLEQIRLALCNHVVKLNVPHRCILPECVIRGPKIFEHSARIECEIPNGVLTPVENPSLIDECRCRDLRQSENFVIGVGFGVVAELVDFLFRDLVEF